MIGVFTKFVRSFCFYRYLALFRRSLLHSILFLSLPCFVQMFPSAPHFVSIATLLCSDVPFCTAFCFYRYLALFRCSLLHSILFLSLPCFVQMFPSAQHFVSIATLLCLDVPFCTAFCFYRYLALSRCSLLHSILSNSSDSAALCIYGLTLANKAMNLQIL